MGRPPKWASEQNLLIGLPPLRQYWREINRQERDAKAEQRAKWKTRDKKRPKCRCEAYPWPHRPGGGLCRFPDTPLERWQPKSKNRPYRNRYVGLRQQIARANNLHPIRDRALIDALLPGIIALAKQFKRACPRLKYRNMEIVEKGKGHYSLTGSYQTAGPKM